jgi:gamma-tubulin complex component 3
MLEYAHGELGWDVFTLEYKVDAPLDTLLDPGSLEKYKRVFAHLWAMKRVEGALSSGWMRVAGAGRVGGRLEGEDVFMLLFFLIRNYGTHVQCRTGV